MEKVAVGGKVFRVLSQLSALSSCGPPRCGSGPRPSAAFRLFLLCTCPSVLRPCSRAAPALRFPARGRGGGVKGRGPRFFPGFCSLLVLSPRLPSWRAFPLYSLHRIPYRSPRSSSGGPPPVNRCPPPWHSRSCPSPRCLSALSKTEEQGSILAACFVY